MMFYDANYLCYVANSYNNGHKGFARLYAQAQGPQAQGWGHIYQANLKYPCYKLYIPFQHSKNLPKPKGNCSTGFIVTDANFDGGKLF